MLEVIERLKAAIVNVQKDIDEENSRTYSKEIATEIAEAEAKIRKKYADIKAENIDKLNRIKEGLEYVLDDTAAELAEQTVSEEEKKAAET